MQKGIHMSYLQNLRSILQSELLIPHAILPGFFVHVEGASGKSLLAEDFKHSNPGAQDPQK